MINSNLNPVKLLADDRSRLTLKATLKPTSGLARFQPAGFPEIGHVIYDAPQESGDRRKVCILDSAASMANHLESVCFENPPTLDLAKDLSGMPYVECRCTPSQQAATGEESTRPQLVVTTLSEGHRLASTYFLKGKASTDGSGEEFIKQLRREFGIEDLGNRSHPLPEQWWNVFATIFRYDPNSLVHGVLFPSMGIKLPRLLTAHLEAFDAARVSSSGVKFDKLGKTSSGQPIFAVDEEVASEIIATFVIDLALLRSFGRGEDLGLNDKRKLFLLSLALWKIKRLLGQPFRYRTNCDLELAKLRIVNDSEEEAIKLSDIDIKMADTIKTAEFCEPQITTVYWNKDDLFCSGDSADPQDTNPE